MWFAVCAHIVFVLCTLLEVELISRGCLSLAFRHKSSPLCDEFMNQLKLLHVFGAIGLHYSLSDEDFVEALVVRVSACF